MSILAEAAAGVASGELLKAILETIDKAVMFKPTLEGLRSTLSRIAPAMKDIEQLNIKLGHPKEELESLIRQMKEGTELVYKCSQFRKLNCLAKVHYQRRLEALQESLLRFFHLDMIAYAVRDLKEILLYTRRNNRQTFAPVGASSDSIPLFCDSDPVPIDVNESDTPLSEIIVMVLKIHMHCEACPQKIKGCIQSMKGVESVEPDPKSMQVSVKGVYDPAKLVEYVHKRTGKQAVIVKKEPEKKEKVEEAKEEDSRKEKKSDGEGEENKEKKEEAKGEAKAEEETTAAAASTGESNNEVPEPQIIVTVLKIHMHCKACAQKIKGCIQSMKGVESVEPDLKNMQVSVKGMYDPAKLVEYVHKRTGKQAVIVKKEPEKEKVEEAKEEEGEKEKKNDGEGEEKKEEAKGEAKAEEETTAAAASTEESNIEVPEPQIIVTVLKIHMHCKACPQKIKRCIQSMKGVESVEPDLKSMRVSVKGVYDPAKLVEYVHKRTGKQAVIVKKEPEKKEKVEEAKQEKKEER